MVILSPVRLTNLPQDELLDQLSDEHRALVEADVYTVWEGKSYPVLRWAHGRERGRTAPGTGVVVNQADPAVNGRKGAWKNTDEYQALLRKVIPADEDPNKRGTFAWLVSQGLNAAEGGDVKMAMTCPECEHEWTAKVWKRPDANAIIKLMEMVHGRAVEQKDINIRAEAIYRLLDEREDLKQLTVHEVDPHEKAKRRKLEPEDADWKEVPV